MMGTAEIMKEIKSLPVSKRVKIVQQTLQSIRQAENQKQLQNAAALLYNDYATDSELTAFTALDMEGFYEAR